MIKILKKARKKIIPFSLIFTLFSIVSPAGSLRAADNPDKNTSDFLPENIIVMKDGTNIYCRIIEYRGEEIYIETRDLGKFTIPLAKIAGINPLKGDQIHDTELTPQKEDPPVPEPEINNITKSKWFSNPNDTRLFFAPTARNLKKGKGYIQDIYVFLGSANYGITDNISIGGMVSLIPFIGLERQVIALTPKFGTEIYPGLNIAGGGLYAFSPQTIGQLGVVYGLGTYGNSDSNVTVGGGYGIFLTPNSSSNNTFIGILGGMYRITEYIAFITENWGIYTSGGNLVILSGGVRFFGDRLSADLGFVSPLGNLGGIPVPIVPYVDFVFNF